MRRKPANSTEPPIVDEEVLERAKQEVAPEPRKKAAKCVVCGGECAPTSTEGLCWVCRRLKISAWRDSDPQAAVQE